jgi:hypothetical protein
METTNSRDVPLGAAVTPAAALPAPPDIDEPPVRSGIESAIPFAGVPVAPGATLALPSARGLATSVASSPERAPEPADEVPSVRRVLAQYEAAYSALDAAAAEAVWPGVDGKALSRAFEGLASQRVSLGQCEVAVAGATARADCRGTAQWSPKVGGGPRRESRYWLFALQKTGGTWQIVDARVR